MRPAKKSPADWPYWMHEAIQAAVGAIGESAGVPYDTHQDAERAARSFRKLLVRLQEWGWHRNSDLARRYNFRSSITETPGGGWLLGITCSGEKVVLPPD